MPRPLVIGNGQLLICFDNRLVMRDLYYPHVGQVNHIVGQRNQIGLWVDGQFTWLGEDGWDRHLGYQEGSLVTNIRAVHDELGLELAWCDGVHPRESFYLRQMRLTNRLDKPRSVRVYATYDFDVDGSDIGDTALWDPTLQAVCHYKRDRWFLMGGRGPQGPIAEYATGRKRFQGAEGTWRDAEDGRLECHPVSQGAVDSTIGLVAELAPKGGADFSFWIVCGTNAAEVKAGHARVMTEGPDELLAQTERYWRSWAEVSGGDIGALPADLREPFRRSLLVIRTQTDHGGAILAANDSDILQYNRDHYSYMWPRDGALVAAALDRAGCLTLTRPFFRFCERVLSDGGYFHHKYNPDGTVGSSWHPLIGAKGLQLPIQEDETALVLWALSQHCRISRDVEFAGEMADGLVYPAADFLVSYRDERTHLPLESYDLWEERRGIFTFTTAAVVAGLNGAAEIARIQGDTVRAERYLAAAAETKAAMLKHLWSDQHGRFLRGVYLRKDGTLVQDEVLESSVLAVFLLGVLEATDPRVEATAAAIAEGLRARTAVGGIARYYDDYYFRVVNDPEQVPGNPWIICTLWLAQFQIARAGTRAELAAALAPVRWAISHALPTGVLPEQVDPRSGAPLSVAPLTWSHATLVNVLADYLERLSLIG